MIEYVSIGAHIYQMHINGKPLNYFDFGIFSNEDGFVPCENLKETARVIYKITDDEQYYFICSILRGRTQEEQFFYKDLIY